MILDLTQDKIDQDESPAEGQVKRPFDNARRENLEGMCHGGVVRELDIQQIDRDLASVDNECSKFKEEAGPRPLDNQAHLESPSKCLNLQKFHSKYNHIHN